MTETAAAYTVQRSREYPGGRHGCWSTDAMKHPWLPIADCACGFDGRLTHPKCQGCHRAREESPRMQLDALGKLGDVAQLQGDLT